VTAFLLTRAGVLAVVYVGLFLVATFVMGW
jgi:hypothetical protein